MTKQSNSVEKTGFDYNKYLISHDTETLTLTIPVTGDSFDISIKPLSWSRRNQIISKNLNWDSTGTTNFSADGYVRDCLKEMIVEAPWGRTTETFLMSVDERLGNVLEDIVPKAFNPDEETLTPDSIKKE